MIDWPGQAGVGPEDRTVREVSARSSSPKRRLGGLPPGQESSLHGVFLGELSSP